MKKVKISKPAKQETQNQPETISWLAISIKVLITTSGETHICKDLAEH